MRKILFTFIFSFVTMFSFMPQKAQAVSLGPFEVGLGFCQQVQKLSAILNSYTIVQWPVGGFPGVTMGLLSNTSVVLDFCGYLVQLESMDTTNAIFFSANYLNQLTGKKWDDNFQQIDRTWNLANTLYDFDSGEARKGALESASTHRELNDFIKDSSQWYNNRFNGKDSDIKTRQERESQMNRISNLAYKRAILTEATNCPEPDGTQYAQIYDKNIKPLEKIKDQAQEDYDFYRSKLYEMGPRFLNNEAELRTYQTALEGLVVKGVSYGVTTKSESYTTQLPTKKLDENKKPIISKTTKKRNVNTYTVQINDKPYTDFKNDYSDQWKTWVTAQFIAAGSYGLLDDPQSRIEDEFKDLNYECNKNKLARTLDDTRASYEQDVEKKYQDCLTSVKMNQKTSENLFNYYVTQMQNSVYKLKKNNALIWSLESKYLGRNRSITVANNATENYQQEDVKCDANLTPAEMDKLQLKQQGVENALNEEIAKEVMKQNIMMDEQNKQQEAYTQDQLEKTKFAQKKMNDEKQARTNTGTVISPIRGTPGNGRKN